ncbi:unnamed protein product, partial [Prorocentrum cordatum]
MAVMQSDPLVLSSRSVVHAVSHWLSEACTAGLEMDHTKAHNSIARRIVEEAFGKEVVPETVILTCRLAWAGPRVCCVSDELAEAIWPTKALPQGGSCAPGAMTATQAFDSHVGVVENATKRQEWDAQGKQLVEHLGFAAAPAADPSQPIFPMGGWNKLLVALAVLALLPGAMD